MSHTHISPPSSSAVITLSRPGSDSSPNTCASSAIVSASGRASVTRATFSGSTTRAVHASAGVTSERLLI